MTRITTGLFALTLLAPLSACKQGDGDTNVPGNGEVHDESHHAGDLEGREVVKNWEAKTGDVTVCPMSGKKFEVKDDSGRYEYQGYTFVFCCNNCLDKIAADPGKYLDALVEEAGGSAGAEESEAEPE